MVRVVVEVVTAAAVAVGVVVARMEKRREV